MPADGLSYRLIARYVGSFLLATREDNLPWLFVSERQAQLTHQATNYIVRPAGEKAELYRVWPDMLRHSCGYYLADQGVDSARHRIPSTQPIAPVLPDIISRGFGARVTTRSGAAERWSSWSGPRDRAAALKS
jgi:Phage integrase family